MITGLGVDIVEINRFKSAMDKHPKIVDRLFTEAEKNYCLGRKKPYLHFAVRFAAKEAILKSLETGRRGIGWKDVEVKRTISGAPEVILHEKALNLTSEKGISKVMVSLSFSHTNAVATAVALNNCGTFMQSRSVPKVDSR